MKDYSNLSQLVESIYNSLEIKFEKLNLNDNDLNYILNISTVGKLKLLNTITCLMYFSESDFSMTFIVTNIYIIENTNNLAAIYNIINETNSNISNGNFSIYTGKENLQIVYRSRAYCGDNFSYLNEKLLKFEIIPFCRELSNLILSLIKVNSNE